MSVLIMLLMFTFVQSFCADSAERKLSVDCVSEPGFLKAILNTSLPFFGELYIKDHLNDPLCSVSGNGSVVTLLKLRLDRCSIEQSSTLYQTNVVIHPDKNFTSLEREEVNISCPGFQEEHSIADHGISMNVSSMDVIRDQFESINGSAQHPVVQLRIYDFESDEFLESVKIGQIVELEVTIRNGNVYKGRIKECNALGGTEVQPIIRNFCPVDLSVSDKVYVDDQSLRTSKFYLYVPFKAFRFKQGKNVSFNCQVIICTGPNDCPEADCGNFTGTSYGRRRRSSLSDAVDAGHKKPSPRPILLPTGVGTIYSVDKEVTIQEANTPKQGSQTGQNEALSHPKSDMGFSESEVTSEESDPSTPRLYLLWVIGGVILATALLVSLALNAYLIVKVQTARGPVVRNVTSYPPKSTKSNPVSRRHSFNSRSELIPVCFLDEDLEGVNVVNYDQRGYSTDRKQNYIRPTSYYSILP